MICNAEAQQVYDLYADLEASFLELSGLIANSNGGASFNGQQSLYLFWQHFELVNQRLHRLLTNLTSGVAAENCDTGAAGAAIEQPSPAGKSDLA